MRTNEIEYRRATIDDIDILVNYRIQFLYEFTGHIDDEVLNELKAELREYFIRTIPTDEFIAYLAEHQEEVVATSGLVVWQTPSGITTGRVGYILNMFTLSEARGMGIGTRLLDLLIEEAKRLELKFLHLHATKDGEGIYRRAGFREPKYVELKLRLDE